jgi:predicted DCC family thiol-disulfide oxidoreductase YuxK
MLYVEINIMIFNRYTHTTTTQQRHNKSHFVVVTDNVCKFCCGFVSAITDYYKVNYRYFTTKQQKN